MKRVKLPEKRHSQIKNKVTNKVTTNNNNLKKIKFLLFLKLENNKNEF